LLYTSNRTPEDLSYLSRPRADITPLGGWELGSSRTTYAPAGGGCLATLCNPISIDRCVLGGNFVLRAIGVNSIRAFRLHGHQRQSCLTPSHDTAFEILCGETVGNQLLGVLFRPISDGAVNDDAAMAELRFVPFKLRFGYRSRDHRILNLFGFSHIH